MVDDPNNRAESAGVSTTGKRHHNEDSFVADDTLGLYVVADGVGGHTAGEVASAMAVTTVREIVANWRADPKGEKPTKVVSRAVDAACAAVHHAATSTPSQGGMATTLTILLVDGDVGHMAHAGDSRLYLIRDGELEQLSTDHTLAAELYRGGAIVREQVETHPHAHVLTRSCGSQQSVMAETLQLELRPDDVYLLSSDGLNPAISPEIVVDALAPGSDLPAGLGALVDRALAQGSRDNITAVAWRYLAQAPAASAGVVAALRSVPLFEHLSTADLCRVATHMERRKYDQGETILTKGEQTDRQFVVALGKLKWELEPGHFGELGQGASIGTTTLMRPRRSPGTLTAIECAVTWVLTADEFRRLVRRRERLGVAVLSALAEELSDWIDPDSDRGVARPPHGLLIEF